MEYPRDVNGFVMPPILASTGSRSYGKSFIQFNAATSAGSGQLSGMRLIKDLITRR
jgi:hypothetical protein